MMRVSYFLKRTYVMYHMRILLTVHVRIKLCLWPTHTA